DRIPFQAQEPGAPHPQPASTVLVDGVNRQQRHSRRIVDAFHAFPAKLKQTVIRSDPNPAGAVLVYRSDKAVGQPVFAGERTERTIAVPDQSSSLRSDP